jgi:hypothetical protein
MYSPRSTNINTSSKMLCNLVSVSQKPGVSLQNNKKAFKFYMYNTRICEQRSDGVCFFQMTCL